jgi:hypothetical protein
MSTAAIPRQSERINSAKDLKVYKLSYELAMKFSRSPKAFQRQNAML